MKIPEGCEGCTIFKSFRFGCNYIRSKRQKHCPCLMCLIKMTCAVACAEYLILMIKDIK